MKADNTNYSNEITIHISPEKESITVEERKSGGVCAYKEISPIDLYYLLNESYRSTDRMSTGFLPENCLHVSMSSNDKVFVLWNKDLHTDMVYRDTEYPDFPIPRLVFGIRVLESGKVADCTLGVVADEKPRPETQMFHYPFSNVHPDSRVCIGNNVLPRYKKMSALANFPRFLMGIPDNDDMYSPSNNRLNLKRGELMEHLRDKEPAYYYSHILVPNGKTLADFIGGVYGEEDGTADTE